MKVMHVNFARGFRGGERQTLLLIEALAEYGVPQVLVARHDSPLHGKVREIPRVDSAGLRKPYAAGLPRAARQRPDLVHAHDAHSAQWALLNHWWRKTPYVITRRVPNLLSNVAYTRAVYRNAASVIALSGAIRASVRRLLPEREVHIIPSMYASLPVDDAMLGELRRRYRGRFVIGHIGALVNRNKGQAVLIEAAKKLESSYPDLQFVLLGEGDDEDYLKGLAQGRSNVDFVGFSPDVGTWISLFDVFAFPSYAEGLGSTLLDVMQHGRPIVATAVGGIPDVIEHERNGLLVAPGRPDELAGAIERLYLDGQLRERLVQAGREDIERYSPARIGRCYYKIYRSLLVPDEQ